MRVGFIFITFLLDVASLHEFAFFKVSRKQQKQIVSTTFKIYYQNTKSETTNF